jgi:beta-glucanase (GH16 family)
MLAAAIPVPAAQAQAARHDAPAGRVPPPRNTPAGAYFFGDEFDGPPGSAPDAAKWTVLSWKQPGNLARYRDDRRNVFLDGNSNLVIRATNEGGTYFSGRIQGTWQGDIGHTWDARVKLDCLTAGCWPAWWLLHDVTGPGGEIDLLEWYGNWPAWGPGTTVHARNDGKTYATCPIQVDREWHTWRCQWDEAGIRFWEDYVAGAPPYFDVAAGSIAAWPFNRPGYLMFPIFNIAIGGLPGGDPSLGTYPADMLVDWMHVW